MPTKTKSPQRNFRPTPENQTEFEFAERHNLNVSELINEVVARHFRRHVVLKVKRMARSLLTNGNGHSKRRAR